MTDPKNICVTGSTGFVGRSLCNVLHDAGYQVRCAQRREGTAIDGCESVVVGEIDEETPWESALAGIDVVIHLAARVHVMNDTEADPLAAFRKVNVAGTERLARAAADAGVRHLIFISSIKVNGEATRDRPFVETDTSNPQDPYGISKSEAEQALRRVESETALKVTIIRPVLIYGPGVKANFLKLFELVRRGYPLPFGAIRNRRSLVGLANLTSLIGHCIVCPAAKGETFLVSDGPALSTCELVQLMARASGKKARLLPISPVLFGILGRLTGKRAVIDRLIGSLEVDSSKARQLLNWEPPYTVEDELKRTAEWFIGTTANRDVPPSQP